MRKTLITIALASMLLAVPASTGWAVDPPKEPDDSPRGVDFRPTQTIGQQPLTKPTPIPPTQPEATREYPTPGDITQPPDTTYPETDQVWPDSEPPNPYDYICPDGCPDSEIPVKNPAPPVPPAPVPTVPETVSAAGTVGSATVSTRDGGSAVTSAVVEKAKITVLPAQRSCASRRSFVIRLRETKYAQIAQATVLVNGKRVKVIKADRLRSRVNLVGLPKGRFTVKITAKLKNGQEITGKRRYRTCHKKMRGGKVKL